jgi:hypothetical protein
MAAPAEFPSSGDRATLDRTGAPFRFGASETSAVEMLKAEPAVRWSGDPLGTTAWTRIDSSRSQKAKTP